MREFHLQIGSYNTNKKITVVETEELLILKSYESYISVFDKNRGILINDIDTYKISNTTKKHYMEFKRYISGTRFVIKHKIYLSEFEFYNLIKTFEDFGDIENKISFIFKEYEMEKSLIEATMNYQFNLNENYNTNVGSLNVVNNSKEELKTRNKHIILCEIPNTLCKPLLEITITTNKKDNKILSSKVKVISKNGLSYNNYNTKELNQYTNYMSDRFY